MPHARRRPNALAALLGSLLAPAAAAQCLRWESPSRQDGFEGSLPELASATLGGRRQLLLGASFLQTAGGLPAGSAAAWDGDAWTVLGATSPLATNAFLQVDGGGALYAGGRFNQLAPWKSVGAWNGVGWATLGTTRSPVAEALAWFDDGAGPALFMVGSPWTQEVSWLERWDGASWTTVATLDGFGDELLVRSEAGGQALYVAGHFDAIDGVPFANVARFDGAGWSALGPGLDARVTSLVEHDLGAGPVLCAAGQFASVGPRIAAWDGAAWSSIGGGTTGQVVELASVDLGSGPALYACGNSGLVAGSSERVWRFDGSAWVAVPGLDTAGVEAIAAFEGPAGPSLCVAGTFSSVAGIPVRHAARWDGTSWSPLGPASLGDSVRSIETFGGSTYVAGLFPRIGALEVGGVARWDGAAWHALGLGTDGDVHALLAADVGAGPSLYLGGAFSSADGAGALRIVRWDGFSFFPLGALGSGANGYVQALASFDEGSGARLFAGGTFTQMGGVNAFYVARWDGNVWSAVGSGLDGQVRAFAVHDDGQGPALFVAGDFQFASGVPARGVARWDGGSWSALGAGTDDSVRALASYDDGGGPALYAAGLFAHADGQPAAHVARWDGGAWSPVGAGLGDRVHALEVFDDGTGAGPRLYAGGHFDGAAARIARWDGAAWVGVGGGADGDVRALHAAPAAGGTGRLWAGGDFEHAGGGSAVRLAAWSGCAGPFDAWCFGDGSGAPCPCANDGAAGGGCASSASAGARVAASGTTAPDAVVLDASGLVPGASCLVLQGDASIAPLAFGAGLRCVGGALRRLYLLSSGAGGTLVAPPPGAPSLSARSAELGDPLLPGTARSYQVVYRDPALPCAFASSTYNATNALQIAW